MKLKDEVIRILENKTGQYVSGEYIASKLNVTRNAVWKAINELRTAGYDISSVTNKGYILSEDTDIISENIIYKELSDLSDKFNISKYKEVSSTNNIAREMAVDGAPNFTVVLAENQTEGRGRNGKKFFSPSSGIYMSVIIRPYSNEFTPAVITCAAALCVARAIEDLTDLRPDIKWVNDVYINNRKVCGILTEGAYSFEDARLDYALVGIGVNVRRPDNGFDESIKDIATYITDSEPLKNKIIGRILYYMYAYFSHIDISNIWKDYNERMRFRGREVTVILPNKSYEATIDSITDDFGLNVKDKEGNIHTLNFGEISLKIGR